MGRDDDVLRLRSASRSVAKNEPNEDFHFADDERGIFAVADGLGRHPGGDVASRLVIESCIAAITADWPVAAETVSPRLFAAAADTARILHAAGAEDPARASMASSLTLLLFLDGSDYVDFSAAIQVLSNLVSWGAIPRCRAVFLPRKPE